MRRTLFVRRSDEATMTTKQMEFLSSLQEKSDILGKKWRMTYQD